MRAHRYSRSRCSICKRTDRAQIEAALCLGLSCAAVGQRFAASEDALWRHRRAHMNAEHVAALLTARKPAEIDLDNFKQVEADRLLAEIVDHRVRLRAVRDLALAQSAFGFALMAENSIRAALQLELEMLAPVLGSTLAKDISPAKIERIERVIINSSSDMPGHVIADSFNALPSTVTRSAALPDAPSPAAEPEPPQRPVPPEPARNVVPLGRPTALWGTQSSSKVR